MVTMLKELLEKCSLHNISVGIVSIFIVLQFVLLLHFYNILPVTGDAVLYVNNAIHHANVGMPYPTAFNNNDIYIQSPGFVNFLALLYSVFGSYRIILLFKVLFNIAIVGEIYYLAKTFFNQRTADISVILYSLMPVNIFVSISFYNELDYMFLALTAFCMCVWKKKLWAVCLAGFFFAYAHTIRPIEIVLIFCILIYFFVRKCNYKQYLALFVPYILFLGLFGFYCKSQTGYFFTTSTVTGHNLIFIANDESNGGQLHYLGLHYTPGKIGYIPNLDKVHFAKKDSIWKYRGVEWIEKHPLHYLKSYINGATLIMFRNDSWSIPKLSPYDDISEVNKMDNPKQAHLILYARQFAYSLVFYITLFAFAFSLVKNRKSLFTLKGIFVLIPLLTIMGTSLLGTETRYHYPFMFAMVIWAAYGLSIFRKKMVVYHH